MPRNVKSKLKNSWNMLSKRAVQHTEESHKFHLLCEEYYGISWDRLDTIVDNDSIIDTIDYGTAALTFEEFDNLVVAAIDEAEQAVSA